MREKKHFNRTGYLNVSNWSIGFNWFLFSKILHTMHTFSNVSEVFCHRHSGWYQHTHTHTQKPSTLFLKLGKPVRKQTIDKDSGVTLSCFYQHTQVHCVLQWEPLKGCITYNYNNNQKKKNKKTRSLELFTVAEIKTFLLQWQRSDQKTFTLESIRWRSCWWRWWWWWGSELCGWKFVSKPKQLVHYVLQNTLEMLLGFF